MENIAYFTLCGESKILVFKPQASGF